MPKYFITADNNPRIFKDTDNKDSIKTYEFDFSSWEEDNSAVTSVTWEVQSGQASIGNEALASSVASAQITLSEVGGSVIKITAATGTQTYVTKLDILTKDPNRTVHDYGLVNGCW